MENNIRVERARKRMSQDDLAKGCDISRQAINAIENKKQDPRMSTALKVAKHLGVSVDELFKLEDND